MAGLTAIAAGAGILTSGYQIADSISDKKQAKEDLENFNRQELNNPYEGIQVDTMASEQMTRANNINVATSVDALQRLGTRGVLAGIPKVNEASMLLQNNISGDLSRQERENDILLAKGEQEIQRIRENREQQALMGIGQELNVANQNIITGATDLFSSGLALSGAAKPSEIETDRDFEDGLGLNEIEVQDLNPENPLNNQGSSYYNDKTGLIEFNKPKIDPLTGLPEYDNAGLNFFRTKR